MRAQGEAMAEEYPYIEELAEEAAQGLLDNRLALGKRLGIGKTEHTPPAADHYPYEYYWDLIFTGIISARAALNPKSLNVEEWLDAAKADVLSVHSGIQSDGSIPNV